MEDDSITKAKKLTPGWMLEIRPYNGLELDCCVDDGQDTYRCDPSEAQFWSVYGRLKEGGAVCFEDFATEAEGRAFAEQLLAAYPHLREHGLWG